MRADLPKSHERVLYDIVRFIGITHDAGGDMQEWALVAPHGRLHLVLPGCFMFHGISWFIKNTHQWSMY